jgi:hypothetical protein
MTAAVLDIRSAVAPRLVWLESTRDFPRLVTRDGRRVDRPRLVCRWHRDADGRLSCSWEPDIVARRRD